MCQDSGVNSFEVCNGVGLGYTVLFSFYFCAVFDD